MWCGSSFSLYPQANAPLSTDLQCNQAGCNVAQEEVTAGYRVPVRAQILLAVVLLPSVAGSVVRICGELLFIVFVNVAGVLIILLLPVLYDSVVAWP